MRDPIQDNVNGVRSLIASKVNKAPGGLSNAPEGVETEKIDEFTLDKTDAELLAFAKDLEARYLPYEGKIVPRQQQQKTYYLGMQQSGSSTDVTDGVPISSNIMFEAEETFLPAALSRNPEPVVYCDNTAEGNDVAKTVKTMLQYHADTLVLRRKLTRMVRHWSVYFIGVLKHGWDEQVDDIKTEVRDPRNFVFDPEGFVDDYGDFVGDLGERVSVTAAKLIDMFPKHKEYITIMADGKLGTKVTYTEWWNDEYCFYTFKDKVLDKNKNPYFNYEKDVVTEVTEYSDDEDDFDDIEEVVQKPINHFGRPKKPYTFLSVFSFGEKPHDETGLIEQNIPNQNRITRRTNQIDVNLSRANNSDVFSMENFNEQTAKQAAEALKVGNPVLIPKGKPISEAIHRLQAPAIGSEVFAELQNSKTDLRSIFGTEGISSVAPNEDMTARGQILNNQQDNSRIGGGIGDAIEQVADNVFNWWVQLYAVYYDTERYGMVLGQSRAVEYVTLTSSDLEKRIVVSVSPDSMKPKDEITEMNQAMALWDKGAIDPKTLLTILNFPDPQTTAENTVLWSTDPQMYLRLNFPELYSKIQATAMEGLPGGVIQDPNAIPSGGPAPEDITEPPQSISQLPASSDLSNVPLNTV